MVGPTRLNHAREDRRGCAPPPNWNNPSVAFRFHRNPEILIVENLPYQTTSLAQRLLLGIGSAFMIYAMSEEAQCAMKCI